MLESLEACCSDLGPTISCKKTKLLAVLSSDAYQKLSHSELEMFLLKFSAVLGTWGVLCQMTVVLKLRLTPESAKCLGLFVLSVVSCDITRRLIKCRSKLRIFKSVIMPILLY